MIKLLDKITASKIAAGEVVDRPVSVVKELVENSIDAGADSIVVEIKKGGKTYIRVSDNGIGIPADQVELAFKRHATSKIENASDLDSIRTLGFRGEALASIAAVTRTQILTRTADARAGYELEIDGGQVISSGPAGADPGTTIIVKDLFYNTPARFKFLKTDASETARISDLISELAIAYPAIRFRFISNGTILFITKGRGDRHDSISAIYGNITGKGLIKIADEHAGMKLEAYISDPQETRTSRKGQIFFVNGRVVKSNAIDKAIKDAYRDKMFAGRFPWAFIFLDIPPEELDVNIHPNKTEVRFHQERLVSDFVYAAVRKGLLTEENIHEQQIGKSNLSALDVSADPSAKAAPLSGSNDLFFAGRKEQTGMVKETQMTMYGDADKGKIATIPSDSDQNQSADHPSAAEYGSNALIRSNPDPQSDPSTSQGSEGEGTLPIYAYDGSDQDSVLRTELAILRESTREHDKENKTTKSTTAQADTSDQQDSTDSSDLLDEQHESPENTASTEKFDFTEMRIIGVVFGTYIVGELDGTMYVMDQHAAHERVFFEKFLRSFNEQESFKQQMMIPIVYRCTPAAAALEESWLPALSRSGFGIEPFGPSTYKISEIPSFMDMDEAERFLKDFIESTELGDDYTDADRLDRIATKACKAAVKAHDHLSVQEITALIKDLSQCENPFSCPHGRPVFIKFTEYQLERMFKRA